MRRGMLAAAVLLAAAGPLWSQGIRITGVSTAQYVELRPVVLDSVPAAQATAIPGTGLLSRTPDGLLVSCVQGEAYCSYLRPSAALAAVPLIQDVEATAWGLTTGLRAYAQLRFRGAAGDAASFWPDAGQRFEALAAYLELDRGSVLARVGRQWMTSGLGFYNFDGALLEVRPRRWLSVEGFGGRSLVAGLSEPVTSSALAAVEPWGPDVRDWLVGAQLRFRPSSDFSAGAIYQREIRTDAAGLYGERVAANARLRLGVSTLSGSVQADLATGALNLGTLRVEFPRILGFVPAAQLRHYRPYFPLWTIWGAFSPVGYDEATASAAWLAPDGRVALRLEGGRRAYGQVTGGMASLPLRNDGWRVGADATVQAAERWTLSGSYDADVGFGQSRSDESVGVRRQLGSDGYLGLTGLAFQTLDELQVQDGRVLGLSADAGLRLLPGARVDGSVQVYRNTDRTAGGIDWNQVRGLLRFEWTVGSDPGLRARRGGAR